MTIGEEGKKEAYKEGVKMGLLRAAEIVLKSHTCLHECKCLLFAERIRKEAYGIGK